MILGIYLIHVHVRTLVERVCHTQRSITVKRRGYILITNTSSPYERRSPRRRPSSRDGRRSLYGGCAQRQGRLEPGYLSMFVLYQCIIGLYASRPHEPYSSWTSPQLGPPSRSSLLVLVAFAHPPAPRGDSFFGAVRRRVVGLFPPYPPFSSPALRLAARPLAPPTAEG